MKPVANYKLGDILVNPLESTLYFEGEDKGETKKSLQPKFIEVLTYLAQQYPRLVGREELIEQIWQDNQPVGEKALTNAIWHLRKNLKNDDTEVIETIRKVGYRLKIEPVWIDEDLWLKSPVSSDAQGVKNVKTGLKKCWHSANLIMGFVSAFVVFHWLIVNSKDTVITPQLTKPQITQLTTSPGSELFVSASPDGHYIAYRWRQADGSVNLYLQDTHQLQAKPQQLTFDDLRQGHSVFSPDGQYLYFARKSVSRGICEMIKMSIASLKQQVIAECPVSGGYNYLDISPDGKTLAFQYSEGDEPSGIYFLSVGDSQASAGNAQNAQLRRFSCKQNCNYRDRDMAFSPDGQTLAVSRRFNRFNENIYLVDVNSGQAYQLTEDHEDIVGLTWHPNGKQLVFATQVADVRQGVVIDIESKEKLSIQI